jgi:CysZ protein
MREFFRGVSLLARGFAFWSRRPGLMWLGLLPALLAAVIVGGALTALGLSLPAIAQAITPFADGWPKPWSTLTRVVAATATVAGALVLVVMSFTALTLLLGEPFYQRIWAAVEAEGGTVPDTGGYGFWRALGDAVSLVGRGVVVAVLAGVLGLVPVVGGLLAGGCALVLGGRLLADELSSRALTARSLSRRERRDLLRGHRARVLGFGMATQLCFLVPGGAIATMPAAVAGSTLLARSLLAEESTAPPLVSRTRGYGGRAPMSRDAADSS